MSEFFLSTLASLPDDIEEHFCGGQPRTGVADFGDEHDVDLIVTRSHGRSGIPRMLLGKASLAAGQG
ncbi:universal stress protein [Halomicrococcus gelatinilyticus]|uniref:universal stress protein n=1 Tax=Halomicrococcus gelatinilyticus TaxID=1702103 RepID=UPI002E1064FC